MHPTWKVTFYNTTQFCDHICGVIIAASNCQTTQNFREKNNYLKCCCSRRNLSLYANAVL